MGQDFIVYGNSKDKPNVRCFRVDPMWWDRDELRKDFEFVMVGDFWLDEEAVISAKQLRSIHERFRGEWRTWTLFSDEYRHELAKRINTALDRAVYDEPEFYDHFVLGFYEADTGM